MSGQINKTGNARGIPEHPQRFASEYHAPVLCNTVVNELITTRDGIYVDGTVGGGGHSEAILQSLSDKGRVLGIDRDAEALRAAENRLAREIERGRFALQKGNFRDIGSLLDKRGFDRIDGFLLDLGVSSHQLDEPERGFSHRSSGPLDMRMDLEESESAAAILNEWNESDISIALRRLGEEPRARRIAGSIVANRPLATTKDLADIVRGAVPAKDAGKALARVFQAIRIVVNGELDALEKALMDAVDRIEIGGRIGVISYHSLEDRRVKRFFRSGSFDGVVRRDVYGNSLSPFSERSGRSIMPTADEMEANPRARSARLRLAERIATAHLNI